MGGGVSGRRGWRAAKLASTVQRNGALVSLVLLIAFAATRYENFLASSPENLLDVLRLSSVTGLVALGVTFVVLTGGLDLSVGSLLALAGVVAASLSGEGFLLTVCAAVSATTLLGLINGLVIVKARVEPFVVTLAMMAGARGLTMAYAQGEVVRVSPAAAFGFLGRGHLSLGGLDIPYSAVLLCAAFASGWVVLRHTSFGRRVYAVGADEEAARLMGLNAAGLKVCVYALSGAMAGVAGVIHTSRVGAGVASAGAGAEFDALAAVVVGGTLLKGGAGGAGSTLVGMLLLAVVFNIVSLEGYVSPPWRLLTSGALLLTFAVAQSRLSRSH